MPENWHATAVEPSTGPESLSRGLDDVQPSAALALGYSLVALQFEGASALSRAEFGEPDVVARRPACGRKRHDRRLRDDGGTARRSARLRHNFRLGRLPFAVGQFE